MTRRALHFVLKIGDRAAAAHFFRDVMGMKFLRHEEFSEGCKAACNGPYDGQWSKSMVGYGAEDSHFVMELTYSYGVGKYERGNDLQGITVVSSEIVQRAKRSGWPIENADEPLTYTVEAPGGYKFYLVDEAQNCQDPIKKVFLSSSDLQRTYDYWVGLLGFTCYHHDDARLQLGYGDGSQCKLEFKLISQPVEHRSAYGRIAFSCPDKELPDIEQSVHSNGKTILTPCTTLETPGKASVIVVILADPDGHEICFVGEEGYSQLSQIDPQADKLIDEAIKNDCSDKWFAEKGLSKATA